MSTTRESTVWSVFIIRWCTEIACWTIFSLNYTFHAMRTSYTLHTHDIQRWEREDGNDDDDDRELSLLAFRNEMQPFKIQRAYTVRSIAQTRGVQWDRVPLPNGKKEKRESEKNDFLLCTAFDRLSYYHLPFVYSLSSVSHLRSRLFMPCTGEIDKRQSEPAIKFKIERIGHRE